MKFFTFLLLCFFVLLFDVNTLSILCWIRKVVHIRSNIFVSFTDSMKCWDRMRKKKSNIVFCFYALQSNVYFRQYNITKFPTFLVFRFRFDGKERWKWYRCYYYTVVVVIILKKLSMYQFVFIRFLHSTYVNWD